MDQVKFVEDSLKQILLGPFLNNLPQTKLLGNFTERQRCIHSPVRYLKWSLLRKSLFSQIARSLGLLILRFSAQLMTRKGLYEMSMYTKARVIKKQTKNHKKSIQNFYEGVSLSRLLYQVFHL